MTQKSSTIPIFEDGKLKPGIYKIQNVVAQTYLDIDNNAVQVCCRPAQDLQKGRGLWEFKNWGAGYTIRRIGPGRYDQYCSPVDGVLCGSPLTISPYPAAWRIESMDSIHGGMEYIRFYWGPKKALTWDLTLGGDENGTPVNIWEDASVEWQTWKLILVSLSDERMFTPPQSPSAMNIPGSLPQDQAPVSVPPEVGNQGYTHSHNVVETNDDGFGTTVTEVTVKTTTTTITTRKKYRVEGE